MVVKFLHIRGGWATVLYRDCVAIADFESRKGTFMITRPRAIRMLRSSKTEVPEGLEWTVDYEMRRCPYYDTAFAVGRFKNVTFANYVDPFVPCAAKYNLVCTVCELPAEVLLAPVPFDRSALVVPLCRRHVAGEHVFATRMYAIKQTLS